MKINTITIFSQNKIKTKAGQLGIQISKKHQHINDKGFPVKIVHNQSKLNSSVTSFRLELLFRNTYHSANINYKPLFQHSNLILQLLFQNYLELLKHKMAAFDSEKNIGFIKQYQLSVNKKLKQTNRKEAYLIEAVDALIQQRSQFYRHSKFAENYFINLFQYNQKNLQELSRKEQTYHHNDLLQQSLRILLSANYYNEGFIQSVFFNKTENAANAILLKNQLELKFKKIYNKHRLNFAVFGSHNFLLKNKMSIKSDNFKNEFFKTITRKDNDKINYILLFYQKLYQMLQYYKYGFFSGKKQFLDINHQNSNLYGYELPESHFLQFKYLYFSTSQSEKEALLKGFFTTIINQNKKILTNLMNQMTYLNTSYGLNNLVRPIYKKISSYSDYYENNELMFQNGRRIFYDKKLSYSLDMDTAFIKKSDVWKNTFIIFKKYKLFSINKENKIMSLNQKHLSEPKKTEVIYHREQSSVFDKEALQKTAKIEAERAVERGINTYHKSQLHLSNSSVTEIQRKIVALEKSVERKTSTEIVNLNTIYEKVYEKMERELRSERRRMGK